MVCNQEVEPVHYGSLSADDPHVEGIEKRLHFLKIHIQVFAVNKQVVVITQKDAGDPVFRGLEPDFLKIMVETKVFDISQDEQVDIGLGQAIFNNREAVLPVCFNKYDVLLFFEFDFPVGTKIKLIEFAETALADRDRDQH